MRLDLTELVLLAHPRVLASSDICIVRKNGYKPGATEYKIYPASFAHASSNGLWRLRGDRERLSKTLQKIIQYHFDL